MFPDFRERASWVTWLAIILAIFGVSRLSLKGTELSLDPVGVVIVLLSAVAYASYITAVNRSRVRDMNGRKLAFYVFIVSTVLFAIKAGTNPGHSTTRCLVNCRSVFACRCANRYIQHYTRAGCASYRRHSDIHTGSDGTCHRRMYRCAGLQ